MQLRSAPQEDELYENFSGRFFRYGRMYWAVITFCVYLDEMKIDMMRVIQFPEVERAKGVYFGLMTADAYMPTQAVAVRCFAKRISEETTISEQDNQQIWIGKQPRDPIQPIVDLETVKRVLRSGLAEGQLPCVGTSHREEDIEALLPSDA
jgi:hypothetical protein